MSKKKVPPRLRYLAFFTFILLYFANATSLMESKQDAYWDVHPIVHKQFDETSWFEVLSIDGGQSDIQGRLGDLYTCIKRFTSHNTRELVNEDASKTEIELLIDNTHEVHLSLLDGEGWRIFINSEGVAGSFYLSCQERYFREFMV